MTDYGPAADLLEERSVCPQAVRSLRLLDMLDGTFEQFVIERMKSKFIPCSAFHEEDMGGQMTAVATAAISGVERRKLRHLKLLRD